MGNTTPATHLKRGVRHGVQDTSGDRSPAAVETGTTKAELSWDKALVGGFLAGAYIAFGGLVAIAVSSGLKPEIWGTLPTLFSGTVFALGLVLVVLAGSELLTGNMALVPIAMLRRRVGFKGARAQLHVVLIGNLIGSLFVAYFLAVKAGVIGVNGADPATPAGITFERLKAIAVLKGDTEGADQIFLRALGCNWLVCLAVWVAMTAEDTGGKILGIFFPIMAFVAIGFDHVVANMFFLPAAIFADVPGISWGDALYNWVFAFPGNLVGAAVFVSTAYWYLYVRGTSRRGSGQPRRAATLLPATAARRRRRASPSSRSVALRGWLALAGGSQKRSICREYYVRGARRIVSVSVPHLEGATCADPPSWARPRRPRSPPARWRSTMAPGSSHREAPKILADPTADNTDVYAFAAPDAPGSLTVVANWIPLEEPGGRAVLRQAGPRGPLLREDRQHGRRAS